MTDRLWPFPDRDGETGPATRLSSAELVRGRPENGDASPNGRGISDIQDDACAESKRASGSGWTQTTLPRPYNRLGTQLKSRGSPIQTDWEVNLSGTLSFAF